MRRMLMENRSLDVAMDCFGAVLAGISVINGIGFIWLGGDKQYSTPTYEVMTNLMPLQLWGIIFVVVAVLYLMAIIIEIPRGHFIIFAVAGVIGAIMQLLYTLATYDASTYQIHTIRYLFFSLLHLVIVGLGVYAWLKTRQKL
ncbi:hypothetical protein [Terribacillus sp. JSM ZJ617]|uniref:hypothetical protein n=1 Tax=Terribacillus sp. JSM ZJ617 TaxID=3342119 RepID=UPI0035A8A735